MAGDTKVVEKGKGDSIFISTTGIGWIPENSEIRGDLAQPGDLILISGTIGDHGIAVLAARGDLGFKPMFNQMWLRSIAYSGNNQRCPTNPRVERPYTWRSGYYPQ